MFFFLLNGEFQKTKDPVCFACHWAYPSARSILLLSSAFWNLSISRFLASWTRITGRFVREKVKMFDRDIDRPIGALLARWEMCMLMVSEDTGDSKGLYYHRFRW
jgi:hypothetical protein